MEISKPSHIAHSLNIRRDIAVSLALRQLKSGDQGFQFLGWTLVTVAT